MEIPANLTPEETITYKALVGLKTNLGEQLSHATTGFKAFVDKTKQLKTKQINAKTEASKNLYKRKLAKNNNEMVESLTLINLLDGRITSVNKKLDELVKPRIII